MNLSGLLLISGRCPFSLNVFLLRASSKPDCLRLWEMCDPLLIFMGIPGIPKTLNKDFYFFFLGLYFAENFYVCVHFTSKQASALLQPFSQQVLVFRPAERGTHQGPWPLNLDLQSEATALILSCAQQHPERFTGERVNVHKQRQGRWLSADVSVFLPSAECYSRLRAAGVVQQWELYRGSLAVLLQTLILLRAARRFQWLAPFIWPGCCPVCPRDHH